MNPPVLIAQALAPDWLTMLGSAGVAGVMLAWFMFRNEARMKAQTRGMSAIERAQNRQTRAMLLLVLQLDSATEVAKREARVINAEIEESEKNPERARRTEDE